jgi:lipopolysaccharide assembly outer membrane protein LptD (OstA)
LLHFGILQLWAQEDPIIPLPIKAVGDSIVAPPLPASLGFRTQTSDSVETDSVQPSKSVLQDKIKYKAKDYVKLSQKEQKIYLYNEAEIYYGDTELKAGAIVMDYIKNEVYAGRIKDSLGNYTQ